MEFIPLTSPDLRDEDIQSVVAVLKSGMLVQSQNVAALEKRMTVYLNVGHALALSNGTATMHLALLALGIGPGDEVIVPAFSYVATANVVELVGAKPVFVDIEAGTFNIDATLIEEHITPRTRAIIPVHEFGLACDIISVMEIARKHNLYVIEDAACALGATQGGKMVGSFGDFGSFSLHPRKAITSGEGGILTTPNADYAFKIGVLRNHGIDMSSGKMEFVAAGYNYRMTDFQAALVNSQFSRFKEVISYKRQLADVYFQELTTPRVILPAIPEDRPHTWQTFHILVDEETDRDALIVRLREKGIGTNYGAQCIPAQKYYEQKYDLDYIAEFPNSYKAYKKGLAIPVYEKLTTEQIQYISKVINETI
jgi:perosamine synthetase